MAWDHIYSCLSKINHVIYGQGGPEPDIYGAGLWAAGLLGPTWADPAELGPDPYIYRVGLWAAGFLGPTLPNWVQGTFNGLS